MIKVSAAISESRPLVEVLCYPLCCLHFGTSGLLFFVGDMDKDKDAVVRGRRAGRTGSARRQSGEWIHSDDDSEVRTYER